MAGDHSDLENFFIETIGHSIVRHRLDISASAQEYLTEMLINFAEQFELYQNNWLDPITFQYQQVVEQTKLLQRRQSSKELGDHCLFLVGYCYDFVRKHGKGQVKYHAEIGASAYHQAGRVPYPELAQNFTDLYLVIGDLHIPALNDEKTVKIYQKWLETGDRYYESLLTGKGIMPKKVKDENN